MEALFRNILTAGFHGSLVIAAVLLLRPLLKKGPKKFLCMLWLLAFIRLLLPFEVESSLSLQPQAQPEFTQVQQISQSHTPVAPEVVAPSQEIHFDTALTPPKADRPDLQPQPPVSPAVPALPQASLSHIAVLSWIWLGVSSLFLVFSLYSYGRLRLSVRDAIKARGAWESEHIETAFILGFIRPRIYIPMGMDPLTRKYILAHERTHLEKGDQWLKLFGYLALALHWFNPLAWVAYIFLCKDIELACDERVVQFMDLAQRKAYSSALLRCSANHIHLAACPVAFGEVSVKERIKAVLHYKKPAFWISLTCVAAIIFVVVCLMTNPRKPEVSEENPIKTTEAAAEQEKAPSKDGPMLHLKQSEIQYTCQQAIDRLKALDSNYLFTEYLQDDESVEFDPELYQSEFRRFGSDYISLGVPDQTGYRSGRLQYGEMTAMYAGDYWAIDDVSYESDPNETLDHFGPNGVTVTFPEGTGIIDGHTLSFRGEWLSPFAEPDHPSTGIFTYEFDDDGNLKKVTKNYSFKREDETKVTVYESMTVMVEDPEITRAEIQKAADSAITWEEIDTRRVMDEQVTEIPSNKTDFDQNFMMGSGQMGWNFQNGGWFMKFGAENATETGLDLAFEFAGAFGENEKFRVSGNAVTDSTFYLETLKDEKWVKYPLAREGSNTLEPQNIASGKRFHVDWTDSYGPLPGGFYRIGMYYTLTTDAGDEERQFCYAKFRIYDKTMNEALEFCRNSLQNLLDQDHYHLIATSNMLLVNGENEFDTIVENVWKSGNNYYLTRSYFDHDQHNAGIMGSMIIDGQGYALDFEDTDKTKYSRKSVADFVDRENVELWTFYYQFFDSLVKDVIQQENTITVISSNNYTSRFTRQEMVFYYDASENLEKIQIYYVDKIDDTKHLDQEMIVQKDTDQQIDATIAAMSSGKTPSFSYAEDRKEIENLDTGVRTKNFVNTASGAMGDSLTIIERAKKDCTLPAVMDMEPGTNMAEVFYDADADMWKVEFTASWDSTIYEAVYLDAQGVTQLTVQKKLPAEY